MNFLDAEEVGLNERPLIIVVVLFVALALILTIFDIAKAGTVTVDTLTDESDGSCSDGDCSLRDAIAVATPGDTVDFSVNGVITLTIDQLSVYNNLTISGPGAANLKISGNDTFRVMLIAVGIQTSISNLTIADGYADYGGGIYNFGALTVTNTTFQSNTAMSYGGGFAHNPMGTLNMSDCSFIANDSLSGGGAMYASVNAKIERSFFTDNHAAYDGGGLYIMAGNVSVINNTFYSNTAIDGGAIWIGPPYPSLLINNTLVDNRATSNGGGIYNVGDISLINNILANNSPGNNCAYGIFSVSTNNLSTDDSCGPGSTHVTSQALRLGALTGKPAYFPLNTCSIAVDMGVNSNCPAVDQRGSSRPQDGDGNGMSMCDIGAFESSTLDWACRVHLPTLIR